MRFLSRCGVVIVAASMLHAPVQGGQGAHGKAAGVVSEANQAYLGTANAATGADVYDCENLETTDGGALRLRVRSGQVYLSASSSAQLEQDVDATQVFVNRGTVGFAAPAGSGIELTTSAGIIRAANGQAATGEVTLGTKEMTVSAIRGDLVLDNGGEFRTIPEGKSAKITFEDALAPSCRVADPAGSQVQRPYVHHRIGFEILAAAAVAVPSIVIWHLESESDSTPPQ